MRPVRNEIEFHEPGELASIALDLDKAEKFPVFTDRSRTYDEAAAEDFSIPEMSEALRAEPERSAIVSVPSGEVVYVGSGDYDLIQHSEAISMLKSSIERTVGEIDFGYVRDYGARIDGMIVLGNREEANIDIAELVGEADYVPPEGSDAIDPRGNARWRDRMGLGVRFTNSFDGGRRLRGTTMGYRAICQNWCVWDPKVVADTNYYHTGTGIGADFFDPIIEEVFDVKESIETDLSDAWHSEIPFEWVPGLLDEVGFPKSYQKAIGEIERKQTHPLSGHTTQFHLWNAATTYLDGEKVYDVGQTTYDQHQSRAWEILAWDSVEPPEYEVALGEAYPDVDDEQEELPEGVQAIQTGV